MGHLYDVFHVDKHKLERFNAILMLSLVGGGLVTCVLGAAVYDIGRMFSMW